MLTDDWDVARGLFGSITVATGFFQVLGALAFGLTVWACLRRAGWL